MNEPVLNTLRPLEEIDHEEDLEENEIKKDDLSKADSNIPETSPFSKKKTLNLQAEKPNITKTVSMESYNNIDTNEIKNSDEVTPPGSSTNFKRADSLASAKLAAVAISALTSKLGNRDRESNYYNEAPKIEMQKSLDETFGQSSVNNVRDWWLTCVDDSEDES